MPLNATYPPTELCNLAIKYGADKCPQIGHCYTPFYYEFFKNRRQSIKKVLEIGVGNRRQKKYIPGYIIGASLRMWRDFFPNAQVFGADIAPESFFEDERIKILYCDERNKDDILKLVEKTGTDIDIVVDDASHHMGNQVFLFETLMPMLDKDITYIIEDCGRTRQIRKMFPRYNSFVPTLLPNDRPRAHDGILIFTNA